MALTLISFKGLKESAGALLYRLDTSTVTVLIVRPSAPAARYGRSIPKGIPDTGESLELAARRETFEETGCVAGVLHYLGYCDYQSGAKRVHCFAAVALKTEPTVASWEISAATYVSLTEASQKLHRDQRKFISLLTEWLASQGFQVPCL